MFSQTTVLNSKGDTTICFTVPQSKFLLKKTYEVDRWKKTSEVCEQQLILCDSTGKAYQSIVFDQAAIMKNQKSIIELKDHQIGNLNLEIKGLNKALRRQKVYRWVAIIGGATLSGYLGYKYVTK